MPRQVDTSQPEARSREGTGAPTHSFSSGAARRAAAFKKARTARASETTEDYVELIGDLIADLGEARLTDIALNLGVAQPTAAKVVQRLQRAGLVSSRPYRPIFLTETGAEMAAASRARHKIVQDFLISLGVSEETAEADSEGIEHYASPETLAAFSRITDRLTKGSGEAVEAIRSAGGL